MTPEISVLISGVISHFRAALLFCIKDAVLSVNRGDLCITKILYILINLKKAIVFNQK